VKTICAVVKFALFVALTFGIYSLWFAAPLLDGKRRRKLREFIFEIWARGFLRLAGCRLQIVGKPPTAPFLLVSNHVSYLDIAAIRASCKCVFVAKSDIENWAIAGTMIKNMGIIFVNRENKRDIPRAGAEIVKAFDDGEGIVIFVEGTTGNGKKLLPFRSSFLEFAAQNNLPVHYASISYKTRAGDPPASEAVCWWRPESEFAPHLFEMFKLKKFDGIITFGAEPIRARNRKQLTKELEKSVNAQFVSVN
jgi:1-acyl-sn-glycerol-3-phosphate acyltransferase